MSSRLFVWITGLFMVWLPSTKAQCTTIVASNLSHFDSLFHECGAAALQMDKVKPRLSQIANTLLNRSTAAEERSSFDFAVEQLYFSPPIRQAFEAHEFPPFAVVGLVAKRGFDLEVCLSTVVPCKPHEYRFVEMEMHDLAVVNPVRSRFRACDPVHTSSGCSIPKDLAAEVFRFYSTSFASQQDGDGRHVVQNGAQDTVGTDDSQERLFELAAKLARERHLV